MTAAGDDPATRKASLYRATEWLHFLGFPLLGYFALDRNVGWDLALVLVATALSLAYAFSLNEVFDLNLPRAKLLYPLATLPPLALALWPLHGHRRHVLVAATLIWTAYSAPVPRIKSIPVLNTLANGVGFALFYLAGSRTIGARPALFAASLACLVIGAQLIHELSHLEADQGQGVRTTAVVFGGRVARICTVAALVAGTVLAGLYQHLFIIPIGVAACLTTVALVRRDPAWVRRAARIGGVVVGLLLLTWEIVFSS